jgi:hypothetical protein
LATAVVFRAWERHSRSKPAPTNHCGEASGIESLFAQDFQYRLLAESLLVRDVLESGQGGLIVPDVLGEKGPLVFKDPDLGGRGAGVQGQKGKMLSHITIP